MYNKRKFNKINDKKVLHKVKKQWIVLSLSMLAMIGAGGAIATQTHASTVNAPQVQEEKQSSPQQTPNANKQNSSAKPVIKLSAQAQKTLVSTTNNGNKGKQLSLSDDASNAVHQTPSIDDIISAVDSNTWNSQYGSKYTDLLSNLNYNNVQVFDNPTAYSNYLYGNSNVPKTNQYQNALTNVKQDLNGFSAYPKVQALQNLINTTTTNPSTYSPVFSNPLFNGFETTFNDNDANTYNGILNNFKSLETDRNNNANQASDLRNTLNGLNSLSNSAKEAVTKFYGISSSDISNEIDRLNSGYIPQEMVYQPIELKYYDIASKTDHNADNEHVAVSRAPIKTVILNASDFDDTNVTNDIAEDPANPYTLVSNPQFQDDTEYNSPDIANPKLQVPDGYIWTGLNGANSPEDPTNETKHLSYTNTETITFNDGSRSIVYDYNDGGRSYYAPSQQQLHFRLIPQSEAIQPEIINAYVRSADNDNSANDVHSSNQYFSTEYLKNNTNSDNCSNELYKNVYGKYDGTTLYLGGDFSQYCDANTSYVQQSKKQIKEDKKNHVKDNNTIEYQELMSPNLSQNVTKIVLEDSTGLYGSLYSMFANMPHLQSVVRAGNFDSTYGEDGPYDISYMFANDPELMSVQDDVNLPWDFYDNDKGGVGTDNAANNTFAKDYSLTDISGLSNWRMSGFTKMNGMFYNDSSLSNFSPISNWDVGGVHQMNDTFSNDPQFSSTSLQELVPWNLRGLETAERLFSGDTKISNISPWMDKPIGTGTTYPDVVDAFRNTGLSFNNNPDSSNPEWILLGNDVSKDSWLPKMYRTEDGHYSFTPDSNTIYFGDPFGVRQYNTPESFNGVFYKNDGYLVLTSIDYTWSSKPNNDGSGNVTNSDIHVDKKGNEITAQLPSRSELIQELTGNGINLSDINKINLVGYLGIPEFEKGSLNGYFANMPNLQSIQGGASLQNYWINTQTKATLPDDVEGLFAKDPKLDSVIGFFGNEQALKEDPDAGIQAQGLIHTSLKSNLIENATSTAHMFDGDKSLFNDDNAQANIDAISSIPMDNITNASYMFNNTGLNDSNIVTNWNLSNLQNADYMFNGCNLTNLNGFSKLGNWHNFYTNSTDNPTNNGEWPTYFNPDATDNPDNNTDDESHSDSISNVELSNLRNASDMFANNPSLDDGVTAIENGNNNWKFNQAPTVDNMFSNTDVGYDAPTVNASDGGYVLGAKPKSYTNKIDFNGDSSADTTAYGELGSTHSENAPQGYHYVNGSNGQFTINNRGTHTFNVAPDTMSVPVELKDNTNGQFLGLNPTANNMFTVNTPGTLSLNDNVLSQLHQQGYQLSSNNNYGFTITPKEVNNSGHLYPGNEPILNVTPTNFTIPVEYKDTEKGVTKSVNPITNQTIHSTPDLTRYAQQNVPNGYQLVTNNQNSDLSTWKVADHIKPGSNNTDTLVVYMEPVQAKAEVKYIGNNGAINPNPSVIGSGDEYSSTKVGHTPVGLPNGYTVTNPNQSITYNNQAQNVNVTPENFNVPFNIVTPDNSNVLFNGTSANKVTVDNSANLELPMTDINNALHSKGYVLNNTNTNFTLGHGDITNANKFNVEDTPSFAASDINATLPIKFEDTESHNQVVGNTQTIGDVKANTQNNIRSEINVPTNYQLASGNVDLTKYSFNNANLGSNNKVTSLVVCIRPVQQRALVVYKNGNTPVNSTPISLGSGDTSALNLASSKFEIGAHPSTLPSGYQISNPSQVMYYNNQSQDVAVTPIQATANINYEYNDHDVTDNASTKSVTGNQSVGKTTFDLASLTVPNGYQLSANNPVTDAYSSNHITVNVTPVQATDSIVYKNGSQTIAGDSNSTNSVTGNKVIAPSSFNTSNLVLPNGYKLAGDGTTQTYNGNQVVVQVVPKSTMTTVHYVYDGQPLTTTTKQGLYNASFDTNSLSLPNGYNLANGNQTISDSNTNVNVDLVPQQKTDTINFVDNNGHVTTTYVSGNSSATGLASSHFTVGNTPNGLPSGYQVEDPTQVINYDGTNHTIMIKPNKPNVRPKPNKPNNNKPSVRPKPNKPNNKPSVKPTPSHKSGNQPNNKPSVKPTPSNKSGNTPNNTPSVNPTPSNNKSGNQPNNKPSVKPTPSNKSGNQPNNNKPSVKPTPSHKSGNQPNNKPSVNPTPSNKSGNQPNNNKPSVKPTPSHKSGNQPNNKPSVNPTPSNKSGNQPNNKPSVNPTPNNKSGNKPNNKPNVNPQTNPQPITPINWNIPISPIMPATSSSANNVSMASTTNHVSSNVNPTMGRASVTKNSNLHASSKNKVTVKYAKVVKAISLHTNRNFTKKNVTKTIKPGTVLRIEKAVKSHNGALRYEVYYNKKNYFIIANQHQVKVFSKNVKRNTNVYHFHVKVLKALRLHTSAKFTKRNSVKIVYPGTECWVKRILKGHGLFSYEVNYRGHDYFITASPRYTTNAYLQTNDFRKHGYKAVRVIKPAYEYTNVHFSKKCTIRQFRRGTILAVRRVVVFTSSDMTRLQLANGRYLTSNKNYVKVIK